VPAGSAVVRVALTLRDVAALDAALAPSGAAVRYSLGANLAWIAWPATHELAALHAALRALGRSGVVLVDPAGGGRRTLGAPTGGSFGSRVRRARRWPTRSAPACTAGSACRRARPT
jgi:hypothetical protein